MVRELKRNFKDEFFFTLLKNNKIDKIILNPKH